MKTTMVDAYADQPAVQAAIRAKLGEVDRAFAWMDEHLPRALAAARNATDPAERRTHAREGVEIATQYVASVKANAMLSDLERQSLRDRHQVRRDDRQGHSRRHQADAGRLIHLASALLAPGDGGTSDDILDQQEAFHAR
ncbi:hypothetical protein AB5I41_09590 [Sphingomonas sp. MMS24-JH45]